MSGADFAKNMTAEVNTKLSNPFNNSGTEVIEAFERKYGIDTSRIRSLSSNNFDLKKLS